MIDKLITAAETVILFFAILYLGELQGLEKNDIYFCVLSTFAAFIRLDLSEIKSLVEKRNEH